MEDCTALIEGDPSTSADVTRKDEETAAFLKSGSTPENRSVARPFFYNKMGYIFVLSIALSVSMTVLITSSLSKDHGGLFSKPTVAMPSAAPSSGPPSLPSVVPLADKKDSSVTTINASSIAEEVVTVSPETSQKNNHGEQTSNGQDRGKERHQILDFAIVGFAKCGTSSLLKFLNIPNQTYMGYTKQQDRGNGVERSPSSTDDLYRLYGKYVDAPILTGFKSPGALSNDIPIETFSKNALHPKLIVSVRHPVTHFQSAYNFFYRRRSKWFRHRPDPIKLLGHCARVCHVKEGDLSSIPPLIDDPHNQTCLSGQNIHSTVCTTQSTMFHYQLSKLYLTPMKSDDEWELLDHHRFKTMPDFNGTLFLMESGQLPDLSNVKSARGTVLRNELERFIGLEPKTLSTRPFPQKNSGEKLINICDDKYEVLRDELIERGEKSARWIIEYLLKSDRVVVANRKHVIELLKKWSVDPC